MGVQEGPVLRGNGAAATACNDSFPRCSAQAVHPFLVSASAAGAGRWVLLYEVHVLALSMVGGWVAYGRTQDT